MAHGRHWPGDVQLEYCEFCGVRLPAAKRIQATTQEYAGRWSCPKCAPLVLNPSYLDYGGPGNMAPTPGETEPHSGVDWITQIQGTTTYASFYAGTENPDQSPDLTNVALSSQAKAIPFTLPRRLDGNTVATVSLPITTISSGTGPLEAAIYKQTGNLTTPGVLVADLGSATTAAGATAAFSPNLYLIGDGIYFLIFRFNGAGTCSGFSASLSDDLLDGATMLLNTASGTFALGSDWPMSCGRVPWARATATSFAGFRVTLET